MNRKRILTASVLAFGLAISGPALADPPGGGGGGGGDNELSVDVALTVGDITVADQDLKGVIINHDMGPVVDNEEGGYDSGSNSINDSAFAAYAGILTQAWNTGVNANTQAGSNIAAHGNVNFGGAGNVPCCDNSGS